MKSLILAVLMMFAACAFAEPSKDAKAQYNGAVTIYATCVYLQNADAKDLSDKIQLPDNYINFAKDRGKELYTSGVNAAKEGKPRGLVIAQLLSEAKTAQETLTRLSPLGKVQCTNAVMDIVLLGYDSVTYQM